MRFAVWVENEKWSWSQAARQIGAANATAAWRLAHGTLPKPVQMARIYLRSGGQVTPNDFYDLPALPAAEAQEKAA